MPTLVLVLPILYHSPLFANFSNLPLIGLLTRVYACIPPP